MEFKYQLILLGTLGVENPAGVAPSRQGKIDP